MADPRGFLEFDREDAARRPVHERIGDWREVYLSFSSDALTRQATRCMDCGIPFCHEGCPLGNLIPEWNDLVVQGDWRRAVGRLHATNNFPEFTGRLCPAPCEGSCVLGLIHEPVSIKQIELEIAERAVESLEPVHPPIPTGRRVAIVGSGPAGLAAAQQLTRVGHAVAVFERAPRPGGLIRYGVPEFKLEKRVIDRRIAQMEAEGTRFETRVSVGEFVPGKTAHLDIRRVMPAGQLADEFDAVVLAVGASRPRDLELPGRALRGIHFAMEYLTGANLVCEGALGRAPIDAAGRHVVILGGGDTGADCLGTVHRQGAASVRQLEILPQPPRTRAADNPWPTWPRILRSSAAHEEGGDRLYSVATSSFIDRGDGSVGGIVVETGELVDGRFVTAERGRAEWRADLVLLALGFVGPERTGAVAELNLALDARQNIAIDEQYSTSTPGVFACGDCARGQSLVVWAIAEGRSAAAAVDRYLMGSTTLHAPLHPGAMALG